MDLAREHHSENIVGTFRSCNRDMSLEVNLPSSSKDWLGNNVSVGFLKLSHSKVEFLFTRTKLPMSSIAP